MFKIFHKPKPTSAIIGEVYRMIVQENDNPFAKSPVRVRVLEKRYGWVKYGILLPNGKMGMFTDESDKEEKFLQRYELDDTFKRCILENQ